MPKTKTKRTFKTPPTGRPSKYRAEYDAMLIKHLGEGQTVESFGALVDCCKDTVYEWTARHKSFSDAKKVGEAKRQHFIIRMGQGIAMGQHRRVASETTTTDAQGNVTKKVEYAPASTNGAVWIFMAKNMLHWRDKQDVQLSGTPGGDAVKMEVEMTRKDRLATLARLAALREACGDD